MASQVAPVSAKTSIVTISRAVSAKSALVTKRRPWRSNRLISQPVAPEDPEPDHGVKVTDCRQADVAENVRLLEPVERLRGHAHEELDADEEDDHRSRPREPRPACRRLSHLGKGRAPFGARATAKTGLGHQEDAQEATQNRDRTADDHPGPQ